MDRNKILWWSILAFAFVLPVSQDASIKILILTSVYALFLSRLKGETIARFLNQAWDLYLYLVVLLVGMIYTSDLTSGLKVLETSMSFLALPVVFGQLRDYPKRNPEWIFYSFAAGVLVACVICLIHAEVQYYRTGDPQVFFYYALTTAVDSHPTYLAYFIIFTMAFGINRVATRGHDLPFPLIALLLVFFFILLMLTGGQTSFVSMLLIFAYYILKYLQGTIKTRRGTALFVVVIIMTVGMFVVNAGGRIKSWEPGSDDSWERSGLWESAIQASPDFFWGVGTGDSRLVLNNYYHLHDLYAYANKNFNSHNQFIQILFTNGIPGLLVFVFMLGRPLYLSVTNNNVLGILTFFPFFIYAMTEVFLGRYQGVVFFALLHQVFISQYQAEAPSFSLKDV